MAGSCVSAVSEAASVSAPLSVGVAGSAAGVGVAGAAWAGAASAAGSGSFARAAWRSASTLSMVEAGAAEGVLSAVAVAVKVELDMGGYRTI